MSEATLASLSIDNDILTLAGELSFASVNQLAAKGQHLIKQQTIKTIDLGGIQHSDSAGLALLLGWLRTANLHQQALQFINVPQDLSAFARVNGVDEILFGARM